MNANFYGKKCHIKKIGCFYYVDVHEFEDITCYFVMTKFTKNLYKIDKINSYIELFLEKNSIVEGTILSLKKNNLLICKTICRLAKKT